MTPTLTLPIPFDAFYATKSRTAEVMAQYGGSFAKGIAFALRYADRDNAQLLYQTFPRLLEPYAPGGRFHSA